MDEAVLTLAASIRAELRANSDEAAKAPLARFFKEGVKLYGMKTAVANDIGKRHLAKAKAAKWDKPALLQLSEELLSSGYQEEAAIACVFAESLRRLYQPDDLDVFERWLSAYVSNWAICDRLCNHSVGDLLMMHPDSAVRLLDWAASANRWVRRGAAVSLIVPARRGMFHGLAFQLADRLLQDPDDMVQKGYGWLLKAVAESSPAAEQAVFGYVSLNKAAMPRTALRYAIEKMPPEMRQAAMAR